MRTEQRHQPGQGQTMTVWTLEAGPVEPVPFIEKYVAAFVVWSYWARLKQATTGKAVA